MEEWKEFKWIRTDQMPSLNSGDQNDKLQVFKSVSPTEIVMGRLRVSYLLTTLAAIAEDPKRIKRMFISSEVNREGVFGIVCYKNGER